MITALLCLEKSQEFQVHRLDLSYLLTLHFHSNLFSPFSDVLPFFLPELMGSAAINHQHSPNHQCSPDSRDRRSLFLETLMVGGNWRRLRHLPSLFISRSIYGVFQEGHFFAVTTSVSERFLFEFLQPWHCLAIMKLGHWNWFPIARSYPLGCPFLHMVVVLPSSWG